MTPYDFIDNDDPHIIYQHDTPERKVANYTRMREWHMAQARSRKADWLGVRKETHDTSAAHQIIAYHVANARACNRSMMQCRRNV